VASVPALPGCHTQGETLEETEHNVKEAIALYLESLADHGEAIPEERAIVPRKGDRPGPVPLDSWRNSPSLTARKVVRALKRAGFVEDRQKRKPSHLDYNPEKEGPDRMCLFIPAGRSRSPCYAPSFGMRGLSFDESWNCLTLERGCPSHKSPIISNSHRI